MFECAHIQLQFIHSFHFEARKEMKAASCSSINAAGQGGWGGGIKGRAPLKRDETIVCVCVSVCALK